MVPCCEPCIKKEKNIIFRKRKPTSVTILMWKLSKDNTLRHHDSCSSVLCCLDFAKQTKNKSPLRPTFSFSFVMFYVSYNVHNLQPNKPKETSTIDWVWRHPHSVMHSSTLDVVVKQSTQACLLRYTYSMSLAMPCAGLQPSRVSTAKPCVTQFFTTRQRQREYMMIH